VLEHIDLTRFEGETVGVLYGGESAERPVSLETGKALAEALRRCGRGRTVREYDLPADLDALLEDPPAAALLAFHGGRGEDGTLQGFLETIGIPYTGSGVLASALALDKVRSKAVFKDVGLMTPPGGSVDPEAVAKTDWSDWMHRRNLELPVVVKPSDGGSSQQVALCHDLDAVRESAEAIAESNSESSHSQVLVEAYLDGEEYTVGWFDSTCLGALEVEPAQEFYDWEAKYESQQTAYRPVERPGMVKRLEAAGALAYRALGCRGVARVDFIASRGDDGDEILYVLEANTIPGMTSTSLVPKLASRQGMDFESFTESMLCAAQLGTEAG
jgi:D-alanine-D-alanine ligase